MCSISNTLGTGIALVGNVDSQSGKTFTNFKKFVFCTSLFLGSLLNAQTPTVILPGNGTGAQSAAPQGGYRYQRGFYLITPKEMYRSGLVVNDSINCIGFTIGAAQSDTTKGKFKVYLQNTTDTVSRVDTAWTTVTGISGGTYAAMGLFPGKYEWQVKTNCSNYSILQQFANDNLNLCSPPTHLSTTNITFSGAALHWVSPAAGAIKFYIEYKKSDDAIWIRDSTAANSLSISGLSPRTAYQWRVKTKCSPVDTSVSVLSDFTTENVDQCNEPALLVVGALTDTSAALSWVIGPNVPYYTVRYRRLGTYNWSSTISFQDSLNLVNGLVAGTLYEWQIRSNCGTDSVGVYIAGPNFMTTGATACYTPESFSADSLTDTTAILTWVTVPGATSYDLRYRAKDVISWTHAIAPMQLVHDDSICIPDVIGPYYTAFKGAIIDTLVYSGEGLYIAWEYQNDSVALSSLNSSLATNANTALKSVSGQDSIKYILSFVGRNDSTALAHDTILYVTDIRPETRLCSSSLADSVEVLSVYALGANAPFYTSYPISAVIRNYTTSPQIYPVTLTVKHDNTIRYTSTQYLVVQADTVERIDFNNWTPSILETDSLIISIPGQLNENVLNNNKNHYIQTVTQNVVSYDDGSKAISQAGTDTAAGLTLSRHTMDGCGKINSAQIYLSQTAKGHSVYAIALDSNKVVLAQSAPFIPDSNQVNKYHKFLFNGSRLLKNEKYYIGLAQEASLIGYFPVGVQYEAGLIRDSAYFRGRIMGDSIWHSPSPGRLMIKAILEAGFDVPSISGDLFLCSSTMDTLIASSIDARYADSVISYSSQYSADQYSAQNALGTPDVYPLYGADPASWFSASDTGRQFLTVKFSNPDSVNFVDVFETFNPGALDSVYLRDDGTGLYHLIWSGTASPKAQVARKNRINFPLTPYKVSAIRLAFNMTAVPGYSAIDAICIGRITTPGIFPSIAWTGPLTGSNDTLIINAPGTYILTTTSANGCTGIDSVTSITPAQVTPVITAGGPLTFCPGDSVTLRSSIIGGNTWSNGATTDSIYVKIPGSYFVIHDDGSGCGTTMSLSTIVSNYTAPIVNITGDTVICVGSYSVLHATSGFSSYYWSNVSIIDSIEVFSPGQYIVTVTDANGCKAADTALTTFGAMPIPSISGTFEFCPGDSTLLTANGIATSYLWSPNMQTSTSIYVKTAGVYTVTLTNADGCSASNTIGTSLFAAPVAEIFSYDGFCPMDSVTLNADGTFSSYLWSTGSTAPSINVNSTGNYILTVTDANGCKDSVSKNIIQFTPPTAFISGTLSFCNGGSATTLDAGLGYASYLWSTGETSNSIVVSTIDTFGVQVTDNNGCTDTTSVTTSLEGAVPAVPGPIMGSLFGMCNSLTPAMYTISPVLNTTCYKWRVPDGVTIVEGFMEDSSVFFNTIKVVFDNTFTGGYIEVSAHNDCGASPSFNGSKIYVSAAPGSIPGAISGPTTGVCKLGMAMYSIPAITTAIGYNWVVPLGAEIVSGQGSPSIQVFFASSYRTGDICVQYSTDCGTSPFSCLNVSPGPRIDSTITGPAIVCPSAVNIIYSIPLAPGATSYVWTVPTGAAILSGQGTNQISVAFGTHSGIVTVTASNVCGTSDNQYISVSLGSCIQYPSHRIGSDSFSGSLDLNVYPNPSDGMVHLMINTNESSHHGLIQVTDAIGRIVYTYSLSEIKHTTVDLDLRNLNKGMYFINLRSESESAIAKIILR